MYGDTPQHQKSTVSGRKTSDISAFSCMQPAKQQNGFQSIEKNTKNGYQSRHHLESHVTCASKFRTYVTCVLCCYFRIDRPHIRCLDLRVLPSVRFSRDGSEGKAAKVQNEGDVGIYQTQRTWNDLSLRQTQVLRCQRIFPRNKRLLGA